MLVTADLYYDPEDLVVALGHLLGAGADESEATYRFDTINTALQAVSNEANATYVKLQSAYEADDKSVFDDTVPYFMQLLSLADELMLDQPERMLGYWIENARKAASSDAEADQFESNARWMVTLWGPDENAALHEYSFR